MNRPILYSQANQLQRQAASKLLQEYRNVIKIRSDQKDSLLDVGCGTGDILMDYVRDILPKTYEQIIGIDISDRMIQFCWKSHAWCSKVDFEIFDISSKVLPLCYQEKFDHVTSFYCLHWVQNQRQAVTNIYEMLRCNGDCFLIFVVSHPVFEALKTISLRPKWNKYMYDIDAVVCPSQRILEPLRHYENLFREIGFKFQKIEIKAETYCYEGYNSFKDYMASFVKFVERMTSDKEEEFLKDLSDCWMDMNLCEQIDGSDEYRYKTPYNLLVVYARK